MRDPGRIKGTLAALRAVWEENPDMRLGQLICNAVREDMLYYIEDDTLVKALEKYYCVDIKEKEEWSLVDELDEIGKGGKKDES